MLNWHFLPLSSGDKSTLPNKVEPSSIFELYQNGALPRNILISYSVPVIKQLPHIEQSQVMTINEEYLLYFLLYPDKLGRCLELHSLHIITDLQP